MFQKSLFKPILSSPNKQQLDKFKLLFSNLPLIIPAYNTGRTPTYSKFTYILNYWLGVPANLLFSPPTCPPNSLGKVAKPAPYKF